MLQNIREQYKVKKSPIQQAYENQIGLKYNEEYEKMVDNVFIEICNLFIKEYPNVSIETPREREKSIKSLKGKIRKLELERLCKLYALDGLDKEDKKRLYALLTDRIRKELEVDLYKSRDIINSTLLSKIVDNNKIENLMKEPISDGTRTAFLRIWKARLIHEEIENKEELIRKLEEKYGPNAKEKENENLLHWEFIEGLDKEEIEKIHKPLEYLKSKDLRGFKIIIAHVPDEIETENEELKQLIEKRKNATQKEKAEYNDLCCIELEREFANKILQDEELLERLNIEVMHDGYKHKAKCNGYIADHIKFCFRDHPEYVFELQLRSMYREELSRANGPAAHDKRAGKKRVFPVPGDPKIFLNELENVLPKYKILERGEDGLKLRKCSTTENMMQYYMGYVKFDSKDFETALKYIGEKEELNK